MKLRRRVSNERGAVLLTVALVMTVLMLLVAGGISSFTMFGAQRELQKAADQAALAGAAALPPVNPGPLIDGLPLPGTTSEISVVGPVTGLDVPLKNVIPDPRAVACAYGHAGLTGNSAALINSFGSAPTAPPSPGCPNDARVAVSFSGGISNCVDGIVNRVKSLLPANLLPTLQPIIDPLIKLQNDLLLLSAVAPGVLTPKVTVTVKSGVNPPLLAMVAGDAGVQLQATATAQRRLKNLVALPGGDLAGVNLNAIAAMPRSAVLEALAAIDRQVNDLTRGLGLGECHVINDFRTDVADIYNPGSNSPSVMEVIDAAADATRDAASRSGQAVDDLAGEAFLIVANADDPSNLVPPLLRPVLQLAAPAALAVLGPLQVPALDVAIVTAHNLEDGTIDNPGDYSDALGARGLFRATLVN
ncbi:MAG: pilus assembly protein TadG-related protein [Actinomycetota bacterium]|nr:pilus assembly protein TadG-related protein [Actinomycetota bacterium]